MSRFLSCSRGLQAAGDARVARVLRSARHTASLPPPALPRASAHDMILIASDRLGRGAGASGPADVCQTWRALDNRHKFDVRRALRGYGAHVRA